jgi:small subunit ribosomal protein S27e
MEETKMSELIEEPTSKYVKIRCPKCKNEQITFGKSSSAVKCLVCSKVLVEPTGGKSRIKARILEVLE